MLIKFSAYRARVFFSFSSVISFKMRKNTEESVLVGGSEKRYFKNKASVALNPFVSLIGRLIARSGRKRGNSTDRQTDRMTKQLL